MKRTKLTLRGRRRKEPTGESTSRAVAADQFRDEIGSARTGIGSTKTTIIAAEDLVMISRPRSVVAERFRRLLSGLARQAEDPWQVLVVTSADAGDGKSTIALNLALAHAESGDRTLLMDADLRRPTLADKLACRPTKGLSAILSDNAEPDALILSIKDSSLDVLPAGAPLSDPFAALARGGFARLVHRLREQYHRVIIDTPPVLPFADADVAANQADGVLIVVRAGRTTESACRDAIDAITSAPVVGTVLNAETRTTTNWKSYYSSKYYDDYYKQRGDGS